MAPPPRTTSRSSDAATRAFGRGDYATLRAVAPDFVAPMAPGAPPATPLFAPAPAVRGAAWAGAAAIAAAWVYALWAG